MTRGRTPAERGEEFWRSESHRLQQMICLEYQKPIRERDGEAIQNLWNALHEAERRLIGASRRGGK